MECGFALEDPTDWPAEYGRLRELDQLLRCPICKEFFSTAMVAIDCGHTFCSLCVRRCLAQETICPSCRAPLTESDLHPNRLIDSILGAFKGGRPQLLATLTKEPATDGSADRQRRTTCQSHRDTRTNASEAPVERTKRQRIHTRSMAKHTCSEGPELADDTEAGVVDLTSSDIDELGAMEMGLSQSTHTDEDSDFVPGSSTQRPRLAAAAVAAVSGQGGTNGTVPCPNCQKEVRQTRINWQLDRCLAGKSTKDSPDRAKAAAAVFRLPAHPLSSSSLSAKHMLPRPTKLAYSLLSESKLRRTLKNLGIPSKGDKQQMRVRHVEWVNMYMANADSETPVAHRQLLRRLVAWEDAVSRTADPAAKAASGAEGLADHATKHADSFTELIAQARGGQKRSAADTSGT
ncbi:E3 ubiquitin-protein ligase rad18 [Coemansia sp. RSA 552]|nr:E3 ubiquitin-protein ligase rad18 [Coemansia sp. RSA 552]